MGSTSQELIQQLLQADLGHGMDPTAGQFSSPGIRRTSVPGTFVDGLRLEKQNITK